MSRFIPSAELDAFALWLKTSKLPFPISGAAHRWIGTIVAVLTLGSVVLATNDVGIANALQIPVHTIAIIGLGLEVALYLLRALSARADTVEPAAPLPLVTQIPAPDLVPPTDTVSGENPPELSGQPTAPAKPPETLQ